MLTAISNVKIDESNSEQILDFLCCLKSIQPIDTITETIINIEDPSDSFFNNVEKFVRTNLKNATVFCYGKKTHNSFGEICVELINHLSEKTKYVTMVESDHFCLVDSMNPLSKEFLYLMERYSVDVVRASFNKIENTSADGVENLLYENHLCRIFEMNEENYLKFQHKYPRYYIGTNCIFKKDFATKLFSQNVQNHPHFSPHKPHAFEIPLYSESFKHVVLIPKFEFFSPMLDENHGESNISIKLRKPEHYSKALASIIWK